MIYFKSNKYGRDNQGNYPDYQGSSLLFNYSFLGELCSGWLRFPVVAQLSLASSTIGALDE